ncbi:MAG: hypothetical protein LBU34_06900, partial [Planctomycetaceae bacterium]|nr:hypothetical protein [Planctomycetaceae bacterium]
MTDWFLSQLDKLLNTILNTILEVRNPVFVLTVRMRNCRRIFGVTFTFYSLVLTGLLIFTLCFSTPVGNFTQTE